MHDEVSLQLSFLLGNIGKVDEDNKVRLQLTYRDDKIRIAGIVAPSGDRMEMMTVHLNVASSHSTGHGEDRLRFGIPRTDDENETLVYQWKGQVEYFRPGRWMEYLKALVEQQNQKNIALMQLNNSPIDDEALFGPARSA